MSNKIQAALTSPFVSVMAIIITIALITLAKPRSQLTISYLSQTNEANRSIAFFAITNVGNVPITSHGFGVVEILGQNSEERVYREAKLPQLNPSGHDTAKVSLETVPQKPWRFTIYCSRPGMTGRSWVRASSRSASDWISLPQPPNPLFDRTSSATPSHQGN